MAHIFKVKVQNSLDETQKLFDAGVLKLMFMLMLKLIILVIIIAIIQSPSFKGFVGEKIVQFHLKRLDKMVYTIYNDLYIPKEDGTTSQIDHVVVSPYGVFVIETKNYNGWIFGSEKGRNWTQVIYKTKNQFLNPIIQNKGHVKYLAEYCKTDENMFKSIIAFNLRATLKKVETTTPVIFGSLMQEYF